MAVNDTPAQGGTISSTTGSVVDDTNASGTGGGVQLTNVNNTPDLTRVSIVGVTIDNTSGSPTINGLDIEAASGNSGAAGAFNLSTNGATTYPTATNSFTTTVSGGAAVNIVSGNNSGNQLYGTNDFTGSYGAKIAAPSGYIVWTLNGAGTENFVANGTAIAGISETAGNGNNLTALQGTINISGFATGISFLGGTFSGGANVNTTGGGTISGATIGMNINGQAGATSVISGSAITDSGTGILATTSGSAITVQTTSTGTIDGGTLGINASGATGTNTTSVTVGAAIGGTTAPTTAGVQASTTGTGAVSVTANASISAGTGGKGIALTGTSAGDTVTVGAGATVQGAIGVDFSGGTTTLSNSGTIASTTSGNALQLDSGTLAIGNHAGTIIGAIADAGTLAFTNTAAIAISSAITGAGAVTQTGTGATTLTGANTYAGGTTFAGGVLNAGSAGALGSSGTLSFTGGTLQYSAANTTDYSGRFATTAGQLTSIDTNGQAVTYASNLTSSGGTLTKIGAGTLTLTGADSFSGGTTISAGTLAISGTSFVTSGITDAGTLAFTETTGIAISAAITGTGAVTQTGAGNTTLSAASTYSGGTTISAGQVSVTNVAALGTGAVIDNAALAFGTSGGTVLNAISGSGTLAVPYAGSLATFSGALTGGLALNVSNGGSAVLTNAGNSRTGATTIGVNSSLQGTTATLTGGAVTDSGTLAFNQTGAGTFASSIAGAGTVTVSGGGTVTLSGSNTYSGATTISAGTLAAGSASAFASASAFTDNATLDLGGFSQTIGSLAGTGTVTNSGSAAATLRTGGLNASTTFSGTIQNGTGITALTKVGTGTLTLSGSDTFTGGTTINAGTLALSSTSALAATGAVTLANVAGATLAVNASNTIGSLAGGGTTGGAVTIASGDTLTVGGANTSTAYAGSISGAGVLSKTGTGTTTLTGADTYTGGTTFAGGVLDAGSAGALGSSGTLSFTGGTLQYSTANTTDYSGRFATSAGQLTSIDTNGQAVTFAGNLTSSAGTLTKIGAGTLTLTGADTYTGTTTISAGTLQIGNGGTIGSLTGTSGIVDNSVLVTNESGTVTIGAAISGTGSLAVLGTGTTRLQAAGSYTGGSSIAAGATLELGTATSAGTGTITYGAGQQTLRIDAALGSGALFADTLASMSVGDTLDLRGLAYAAGATATVTNNILTVTSNGTSDNFTLSGNGSALFGAKADGAGGTLVTEYVPPTITGVTTAAQPTISEAPLTPFTGVTIDDTNPGASDTLTITLGGPGGTLTGAGLTAGAAAGTYTITGSATTITTDLDGLSFTPTAGQPNASGTTTFALSVQSTAATGATASGPGPSVTDSDPAVLPTISGVQTATQATTSEATVTPFSTVTVSDANNGGTNSDTLTITQTGTGTLSGSGLVAGPNGTYTLTGTAAAITQTLGALVFTPVDGVPNTAVTTSFTLQDTDATAGLGSATSAAVTVTDSDSAAAPTVVAERATVPAGATATASGGTAGTGALAGDSDANSGGTLSITSIGFGGATASVEPGSTATSQNPNAVPTTVGGTYGALTIGADGSYAYIADQGLAIVTAADGTAIIDVFGDTVTSNNGVSPSTSAPSSLAITTSLVAGGSEMVNDPTGTATYSIGATTLTLTDDTASTYGGVIQDGSSGNTGGNVIVDATGGTLMLTGANIYTGGTTINAGTLQLGDGTITGTIVGDVIDNDTLIFDPGAAGDTYAGDVSGSGIVFKVGANTETLSGASTDATDYVSAGTLILSASAMLTTAGGPIPGGSVAAADVAAGATLSNAGTIAATGNEDGVDVLGGTFVNSGTLTGAAYQGVYVTGGGTITNTGMISGGNGILSIDAGALTVTGGGSVTGVSDGINATRVGASDIVLGTVATGAALGAVTGGTDGIVATTSGAGNIGIVTVGAVTGSNGYGIQANASGTGTVSVTANGNVTGTTAGISVAGTTANDGVTVGSGATVTGAIGLEVNGGTTTLSNSGSITTNAINAIQIDSGTLAIGNSAGTIQGALADAGTLTFTNTSAIAIASAITGAGTVAQTGTGTTTLSGANTYTGGTTLAAGTLELASATASGGTVAAPGLVAFTTAAATLQLDAAAFASGGRYAGAVSGFQLGDTLDLRGLTYASDETATLSGSTLTVGDATASDKLTSIALASGQPAYFVVSNDGNGGTAVTLQTQPAVPTVGMVSPSSASYGSALTITGTGDAAGDTIMVYVAEANTPGVRTVLGTTTVVSDGSLGFTDTVPAGKVPDGTFVITTTDTSAGGNTPSIMSSPTTVVVSASAPTGLRQVGNPGNGGTIEITGSGDAVGDMVTIYAATNGGAATAIGTATVAIDGSFDFTATGAFADGSYAITATNTSVDGTQVSVASMPLVATVGAVAPTGLAQKGTATNGGTIEVIGTTTDAVGDTVKLYANGGATVVGSGPVTSGGGFDIVTTATFQTGTDRIRATDTSVDGTQTSTMSAPLAATVISPVTISGSGSTVSIVDPMIAGTTDVSGAGSTITLTSGQTVLGSTIVARDGSWSDPVILQTDGTYTIVATDTVNGVTSRASNVVTLNSLPNQPLFGTITHDVTSPGGNIYALYETILGRAPDSLGLENWGSALGNGTPLATIAQDLLSSAEYASDYGSSVASDTAFVAQLYQDGLHRQPDPSGLQTWTGALAKGSLTRAQVATAIATSGESRQDLAPTVQAGVFVPDATDSALARLYHGVLGRAPDAGGLQNWEAAVHAGLSLTQAAQGFLGSNEYQRTAVGQSNLSYIQGLYQSALGRGGDAAGVQNYETALDTGTATRADVADAFLGSSEFQTDEAGQTNSAYVATVYQAALGRSVDPSGLQTWDARLAQGTSRIVVAQDIVGSAEFAANVTSPAQASFVNALYEGALGRLSDAGGLQANETAMNAGASLASLVIGITQSPEAVAHLAPAVETGFHIA